MINRLLEGGNVFKDAQGQPLTQRISQGDVPATIKWLEGVTGLDLSDDKDPATGYPRRWLGSTGKKSTSGDLDLAVDSNEISKPQLKANLDQFITKMKQDPRDWVKLSGEAVHFKTPIAGDPKKGFVQTDFMLMPNLNWGTFWLAGGAGSEYKGMYRNILMSSVAKALGLKASAKGIISRATENVLTMEPDQAAKILLGPASTVKDLATVETIYAALSKDSDRDAKLHDFREYLARDGLQEPGQVQESDSSFIARLRDRIVNQGMQPLVEADETIPAKKDPRIPHPEDAFFMGDSQAASRAIQGLEAAASNDKNITIKWDGKPALIFGRLPNGRLSVMDKYMFDAGYAAQSPEDWIKYDQQKKSGNLRTDLYPKLKAIWPGLDAATKGSGFYWGDLLWAGQLTPTGGEYQFRPNLVQYSIPANSPEGQIINGKSGGIVVHQHFNKLGDKQAQVWNGQGLENVPGGVAILTPTLGTKFKLSKPNLSAAKKAVSTYGAAVDELLNSLPGSVRQRMQTYFNQRIIGGTNLSLHNWLKVNTSGKQYAELVVGNPDAQGQYNAKTDNMPGKLFTLDRSGKVVPSPAYTGLQQIWDSIYNAKLGMAQQLEQQVHGLKQTTAGKAEGEGFVVNTPYGLVKLVNRGVFSAGNAQQNNPR